LPIFLLHEKLSFLRKFYFGVDFIILKWYIDLYFNFLEMILCIIVFQ
jgi:hypothetical protein